MRKSSHHSVFCKIVYTLDIRDSRVDINVYGVLAPLEFALCSLKSASRVRLGLVEYDINTRNLRNGRENTVSRPLRVVECSAKLVKCNVFPLDGSLLAPRLAVDSSLVLRGLRLCRCFGSVSTRRVCELALLFRKV